MSDRPRYPDTGDDAGVGADSEPTTRTPRWVKVFGIIALVIVLLIVVLLFTRGPGGHGPNRHTSSGDPGGDTPPYSVVMDDHRLSVGGLGGRGRL